MKMRNLKSDNGMMQSVARQLEFLQEDLLEIEEILPDLVKDFRGKIDEFTGVLSRKRAEVERKIGVLDKQASSYKRLGLIGDQELRIFNVNDYVLTSDPVYNNSGLDSKLKHALSTRKLKGEFEGVSWDFNIEDIVRLYESEPQILEPAESLEEVALVPVTGERALQLAQDAAVEKYGFADETRIVVKKLWDMGINTLGKIEGFLDTFYVERLGVYQKLLHLTEAIADEYTADEISSFSVTAYRGFLDTIVEAVEIHEDSTEIVGDIAAEDVSLTYKRAFRIIREIGKDRARQLFERIFNSTKTKNNRGLVAWFTLEELLDEAVLTGHFPESILDSRLRKHRGYWEGDMDEDYSNDPEYKIDKEKARRVIGKALFKDYEESGPF